MDHGGPEPVTRQETVRAAYYRLRYSGVEGTKGYSREPRLRHPWLRRECLMRPIERDLQALKCE